MKHTRYLLWYAVDLLVNVDDFFNATFHPFLVQEETENSHFTTYYNRSLNNT